MAHLTLIVWWFNMIIILIPHQPDNDAFDLIKSSSLCTCHYKGIVLLFYSTNFMFTRMVMGAAEWTWWPLCDHSSWGSFFAIYAWSVRDPSNAQTNESFRSRWISCCKTGQHRFLLFVRSPWIVSQQVPPSRHHQGEMMKITCIIPADSAVSGADAFCSSEVIL